jgi:hypothetical protein
MLGQGVQRHELSPEMAPSTASGGALTRFVQVFLRKGHRCIQGCHHCSLLLAALFTQLISCRESWKVEEFKKES